MSKSWRFVDVVVVIPSRFAHRTSARTRHIREEINCQKYPHGICLRFHKNTIIVKSRKQCAIWFHILSSAVCIDMKSVGKRSWCAPSKHERKMTRSQHGIGTHRRRCSRFFRHSHLKLPSRRVRCGWYYDWIGIERLPQLQMVYDLVAYNNNNNENAMGWKQEDEEPFESNNKIRFGFEIALAFIVSLLIANYVI